MKRMQRLIYAPLRSIVYRHDDRRNGKWNKEGRDNRRSFSRDDDRKFGGKRFDKANKRGGFRNKNIYHDED